MTYKIVKIKASIKKYHLGHLNIITGFILRLTVKVITDKAGMWIRIWLDPRSFGSVDPDPEKIKKKSRV